jgi:predicted nuclease of predicted toxin-antitoxin system
MIFVADESVDQPIVSLLRNEGHTVIAVVEMEPGISDDAVLDIANQEGGILLTADKDFGELIFRDHRYSLGIVLIRLSGLTADAKAKVVATAVKQHIGKLARAFVVISSNSVRIRPRLI